MQYNKVEICGVNTSKLKVLNEKEKIALLKKAQAGDKQAREELINGNLRLVLSVIQRFTNRGENLDDFGPRFPDMSKALTFRRTCVFLPMVFP